MTNFNPQEELSGKKTEAPKLLSIEVSRGVRFKDQLLEKVYRPYFKKIPLIRKLAVWAYLNFGYQIFYLYCKVFRSFGITLTPLSRVKNVFASNYDSLLPAEKIYTKNPITLSLRDQKYIASVEPYVFPEIFSVTILDAKVNGGSNLIQKGDRIIHHDLYDFYEDHLAETYHLQMAIDPINNKADWLFKSRSTENIKLAATFIDACAPNYAHWISEVLPRIHLFCEQKKFSSVPILINEKLHQNIIDSLSLLAGESHQFIQLPVNQSLLVDELIVVSPTGYIPFAKRINSVPNRTDGMFSSVALKQMVHKILRLVSPDDAQLPKKIFIKRHTVTRALVNDSEIEAKLLDLGFSIIAPEQLSFIEQVKLFAQADIVVGATGAAMANLVFCKKGSKVVILFSKHPDMPYHYWQNMGNPLGVSVTCVLGEIVANRHLGIHADYKINPTDILDAISINS